ncbi:MAG: glycosyltransferase family 2 protein [Chloroflexaceae bacterium]|nr:glycosyltransferase family 2 protein [Chloroflexaceae bacterium]
MVAVGIVIVSFNTSELLCACLQSLRACTLAHRTVVVDNASTDDSVAQVRRRFPDVQVHALPQNRGFAAANNIGLRLLGYTQPGAADDPLAELLLCDSADPRRPADRSGIVPPPWVLLLNPDTVVAPGAIEALVAFLQEHPRIGLVGPSLLNPDGSMQTAAFRFPTLTMSLLEVFPPGEVLPGRLYNSWWHGRYPQERQGDAPFPIDHPLGACMLVRGAVIETLGGFDERYFLYSEEIEWCWRIRQAGWAIWQVPQAQVMHVGGAATQQFRHRMFVELHRSRYRFFVQHYAPSFGQMHRFITRMGMLRAVLQTWWAFLNRKISLQEHRARLWAYGMVRQL